MLALSGWQAQRVSSKHRCLIAALIESHPADPRQSERARRILAKTIPALDPALKAARAPTARSVAEAVVIYSLAHDRPVRFIRCRRSGCLYFGDAPRCSAHRFLVTFPFWVTVTVTLIGPRGLGVSYSSIHENRVWPIVAVHRWFRWRESLFFWAGAR